ncbi:MAG: hypothetical protein JXR70_00950 [Spirochaetales bacterium]|nr:hypothetical protein [Spirochaetales bacterium]
MLKRLFWVAVLFLVCLFGFGQTTSFPNDVYQRFGTEPVLSPDVDKMVVLSQGAHYYIPYIHDGKLKLKTGTASAVVETDYKSVLKDYSAIDFEIYFFRNEYYLLLQAQKNGIMGLYLFNFNNQNMNQIGSSHIGNGIWSGNVGPYSISSISGRLVVVFQIDNNLVLYYYNPEKNQSGYETILSQVNIDRFLIKNLAKNDELYLLGVAETTIGLYEFEIEGYKQPGISMAPLIHYSLLTDAHCSQTKILSGFYGDLAITYEANGLYAFGFTSSGWKNLGLISNSYDMFQNYLFNSELLTIVHRENSGNKELTLLSVKNWDDALPIKSQLAITSSSVGEAYFNPVDSNHMEIGFVSPEGFIYIKDLNISSFTLLDSDQSVALAAEGVDCRSLLNYFSHIFVVNENDGTENFLEIFIYIPERAGLFKVNTYTGNHDVEMLGDTVLSILNLDTNQSLFRYIDGTYFTLPTQGYVHYLSYFNINLNSYPKIILGVQSEDGYRIYEKVGPA